MVRFYTVLGLGDGQIASRNSYGSKSGRIYKDYFLGYQCNPQSGYVVTQWVVLRCLFSSRVILYARALIVF